MPKYKIQNDMVWVEESPNSYREICPKIKVSANGQSTSGLAYYEIEFLQMNGEQEKIVIPRSVLRKNSELVDILDNNYYQIPVLKDDIKLLCDYLQETAIEAPKALFVNKTGWIDTSNKIAKKYNVENVYVTCDKIYPKKSRETKIIYNPNDDMYQSDNITRGSLDEWKEQIGKYLECSSLLICAVCAGLGSIIMKPCDIENFVLNFYSKTSKGKTIALLTAQSLFTKAIRKCLPSWDITLAGLEDLCLSYSDRCLLLDELRRIPGDKKKKAEVAQDIIYKATNGSTGIRRKGYKKHLGNSAVTGWDIIILSSAEYSFAKLMFDGDVEADGGQEVRGFNIYALRNKEYGIFEKLPKDFTKSVDLAKHLEKSTGLYYGTPSTKFLREFLGKIDKCVQFVEEKKSIFLKEMKANNGDTKGRIADRFGFLEAVGLLAIKMGILPLEEKHIKNAVRTLFYETVKDIKSDSELASSGLKKLFKALKKDTVKISKKGQMVQDQQQMSFAFLIKRGEKPFYAIRKENFESIFSFRGQVDSVLKLLAKKGIVQNSKTVQVLINGINERQRYYKLDHNKLKALKNK